MNRPARSLNLLPDVEVRQSLPKVCGVCSGDRHVEVVAQTTDSGLDGWDCPHCACARPMPIYNWPWRNDQPGGGAA